MRFNLVSMLSCKNVDKSSSMISSTDIWTDNKDLDDSKQFIENFYDITKKKKKSQFKEKVTKILTVSYIKLDKFKRAGELQR